MPIRANRHAESRDLLLILRSMGSEMQIPRSSSLTLARLGMTNCWVTMHRRANPVCRLYSFIIQTI